MQSGFVFTPEVKFTEVDSEFGTLVGATGGWLTDGRLFIGAGAYWLTGGPAAVDMAYGGGVVEWFSDPGALVSVSIGSLLGFGTATLDTVVGLDDASFFGSRFERGPFGASGRGRGPTSATVRFREDFFVAEPRANLVLNASDWLRIGLGAGYRVVGAAGEFDERLRGFTASVWLQLGPP